MARILVADDHPLFLEAIQALLARAFPEATIETATSTEALHGLLRQPADLAIIDYAMPGLGIDATIRSLKQAHPALKLAVVSGVAEPVGVMASLAVGAAGFIPKTMPPGQIVAAVQLILSGGTYVPTEIAMAAGVPPGAAVASVGPASGSAGEDVEAGGLTAREAAVLGGVVAGKPSKLIGRELGIREVTVKLHLRQIYKKLGASNRAEAAAIAVRRGLVPAAPV